MQVPSVVKLVPARQPEHLMLDLEDVTEKFGMLAAVQLTGAAAQDVSHDAT